MSYENNTSSFEDVRESKQMNATYTTKRQIRLVSQYHILLGYGKKLVIGQALLEVHMYKKHHW